MKDKSSNLNTSTNDKPLKFSKKAVIVILVQVFVYTWIHLILSAFVGTEIAPTTSVAFYGFCGAEAGLLAYIRKLDKSNKQKEDTENKEDEEDQKEEEPYERDFSSEAK